MHILVAGAGIGGLTAGLALLKKGFHVTIVEQASELKEIGAGVQLSPNCNRVLYRLGVDRDLLPLACEASGKEVRLWNTGQTWPLFDLGSVSRERYGFPYLTVHRAHLHAALVAAVRRERADAIVLDARVDRIDQRDDRAAADHGRRPAL
jgi:salicylate hydroxylase